MESIGRVSWYLLQSVRIRHPRTNVFRFTRRELSSVQTTDSDKNTFPSPPSPLMTFRTNETDPSKHGPQHEGRLYKIPEDVFEGVFQMGGFRQVHKDMFKLLNERCIMVRKPALEVIDYLKRSDFSRPVNRYILCKKNDSTAHTWLSCLFLWIINVDNLINLSCLYLFRVSLSFERWKVWLWQNFYSQSHLTLRLSTKLPFGSRWLL